MDFYPLTEDAFLVNEPHFVLKCFFRYMDNIRKGYCYTLQNLETIARAFAHRGFMNDCVHESIAFSKLIWILANHPEKRGWPILAKLVMQGQVRFYEMTTSGIEWAFDVLGDYEQFAAMYPDAAELASIPKFQWDVPL